MSLIHLPEGPTRPIIGEDSIPLSPLGWPIEVSVALKDVPIQRYAKHFVCQIAKCSIQILLDGLSKLIAIMLGSLLTKWPRPKSVQISISSKRNNAPISFWWIME